MATTTTTTSTGMDVTDSSENMTNENTTEMHDDDDDASNDRQITIEGPVIRKKKRGQGWLVVNILDERINNVSTSVWIQTRQQEKSQQQQQQQQQQPPSDMFYIQAIVQVVVVAEMQKKPDNQNEPSSSSSSSSTNTTTITATPMAENTKWIAQSWKLIQCAPNLKAIPLVWEGIVKGIYSPQTLLISDEEYNKELLLKTSPLPLPPTVILEKIQNDRQKIISNTSNAVESSSSSSRKGPRKRSPHVRRRDIRLLDQLEAVGSSSSSSLPDAELEQQQPTKWTLYKPQYVPMDSSMSEQSYCQVTTTTASPPLTLPPNNNANLISHPQRRLDYMQGKKHPQITWMIQRLYQITATTTTTITDQHHDEGVATATAGTAPRHILDVGGGRGDLAIALAIAFPNTRITVVDKNTPSLLTGQEYAKEVLGVEDCNRRLRFIDADFGQLIATANLDSTAATATTNNNDDDELLLSTVDWVVALHACGDLSDLALQFARTFSCSFLLCPCCYTKRYCFTKDNPPAWTHYASSTPTHPNRYHNNVKVGQDENENDNDDDRNNKIKSNNQDGNGNDNDTGHNQNDPSATLGRLAELSEAPKISKRAMTIVNSMRLADCKLKEDKQQQQGKIAHDYSLLRLEEYDSQCSGRNIVLVGASS